MYTMADIACSLKVNINTLRYWLKRNKKDCENAFYDFDLSSLLQKVKVCKKITGREYSRDYVQYLILDIDEFLNEYRRYTNYVKNVKHKKRIGGLLWSNSAIDCYKCSMNCEKCFNQYICSAVVSFTLKEEPPMKIFVRKLLLTIGKPPL